MQMRSPVIGLNARMRWRSCQAVATRKPNARVCWGRSADRKRCCATRGCVGALARQWHFATETRSVQVGIALCEHGYYLTHTANLTHDADEEGRLAQNLEPLMQRGQVESRGHEVSSPMTEIGAPSLTRLVSGAGAHTQAREIRIAVVDPYPIFRIGVVQVIARCEDAMGHAAMTSHQSIDC